MANPTITNWIKLWWHCLIRTLSPMPAHRMCSESRGPVVLRIGCSECDPYFKEIFA
jgi:hypothetical protein